MLKKSLSDAGGDFQLSEYIPYLFKRIHSELEVHSAANSALLGLNVAVWRILAVLWHHGELPHSDLAGLTSLDVSALSRVSMHVQRDGLIRRTRSEEDQRVVRVTLTEKGRDLVKALIPGALEADAAVMGDLSPEEIRSFIRCLHVVVENLGAFGESDQDFGKANGGPSSFTPSSARVPDAIEDTLEHQDVVHFDLSRHLPYLFKHIHSQLESTSAEHSAEFGVSVAVWRILAVLWQYGELSHHHLAKRTSLDVSSLSRLSKTVQRDGLIDRTRSEADQRVVQVNLTEKGRAVVQTLIPGALAANAALVRNLLSDDVKAFRRMLHVVVDNLAATRRSPPRAIAAAAGVRSGAGGQTPSAERCARPPGPTATATRSVNAT